MKFLFITGPLYPLPGNNANLTGRLIPFFLAAGHEVHLFTAAYGKAENKFPKECFGVPVHWMLDQRRDWKRKFLYPAMAKLFDPDGPSDLLQVQILLRALEELFEQYPFDVVLSTMEPFTMARAASLLRVEKKALYIMDPPESVSGQQGTVYRNRTLYSILKSQNTVITTPFIKEAIAEHALPLPAKVETVGFPLITPHTLAPTHHSDGKFHLLFCGWLYSNIRSPKYFLDIVSLLDERFEVTFMGRECEKLQERFPTETKAKLITLPNQPYDVALQAMADADVLINIGNSVPVHMPSKTLEYINTGKPMVNFYKFSDCPTLYYTKRYPLALNLFEEETDLEAAAARFIRFCEENVGKMVDRGYIETEFADSTPQYIAQKIIESLEK